MKGFTLVGFLGRGGLDMFPKRSGENKKQKKLLLGR
jgi:hypothetical protein